MLDQEVYGFGTVPYQVFNANASRFPTFPKCFCTGIYLVLRTYKMHGSSKAKNFNSTFSISERPNRDPHRFGSLDSDPESRIKVNCWIQIRNETNADPQHWV